MTSTDDPAAQPGEPVPITQYRARTSTTPNDADRHDCALPGLAIAGAWSNGLEGLLGDLRSALVRIEVVEPLGGVQDAEGSTPRP